MNLEGMAPEVAAVGLTRDGNRIEVPIRYAAFPHQGSPSVTQRLYLSPNPTRGTVDVQYTLKSAGLVEISVYDLSGRKIATVESGTRVAGAYRATWNTRDASGEEVAAGIYFVKLRTAAETTAERLTVVR
jgi:hypothetical protein